MTAPQVFEKLQGAIDYARESGDAVGVVTMTIHGDSSASAVLTSTKLFMPADIPPAELADLLRDLADDIEAGEGLSTVDHQLLN
jgi:hypothetical protein